MRWQVEAIALVDFITHMAHPQFIERRTKSDLQVSTYQDPDSLFKVLSFKSQKNPPEANVPPYLHRAVSVMNSPLLYCPAEPPHSGGVEYTMYHRPASRVIRSKKDRRRPTFRLTCKETNPTAGFPVLHPAEPPHSGGGDSTTYRHPANILSNPLLLRHETPEAKAQSYLKFDLFKCPLLDSYFASRGAAAQRHCVKQPPEANPHLTC
ncbi:hypothetical protein C8R43DRAFT_1140819 [Mycena crocata]|nr:hypothetical protein C8R43DRAFT_1140819 [Mycena crocata]